MLKQISFLGGALLLCLIIPQAVAAAADFLLSGWAWSSNIGWVNFGNFDPPSNPDYGVKISKQTGEFSGYAWSSSVGWVRFDPPGPYPAEPQHGAKIKVIDGKITDGEFVTGWARSCSVFASGCEGNLKPDFQRGGWDGWGKMSGTAQNNQPYGVKKVTEGDKEKLVGFAWAGDNIGWLSFYEVLIGSGGQPPFSVICSTNPSGTVNVNKPVQWKVDTSGGVSPYTYCWGDRCDPPRGGDVHSTEQTVYVQQGYSCPGTYPCTYEGRARVIDSVSQTAECDETIMIEEPSQELKVDLKAKGPSDPGFFNGPVSIVKDAQLDLQWTTENNPDRCEGSGGFVDWNGKILAGEGGVHSIVASVDPIVYQFWITCYKTGYDPASDYPVVVNVTGEGGGNCLERSGSATIRIREQPLGTPAISTVTRVKNICPYQITTCVKDVISRRPPENKSLAKPVSEGGILAGGTGIQKLPACWLKLSTGETIPHNLNEITSLCYNDQACTPLKPQEEAKMAIVVQRPLKLVSDYHPYNITIYNSDPLKPNDRVNVLFEYLVTKFEER